MAVTSINITRVSSNLQTISLLDSLRRNTLGLFLEQTRLASGNRINAPSEDPVGAAQALKLTQVLERQDQILSNIRHADSFLAISDAAIGEVNDLLIDAHAIASEMVNTTVDQSQRDSMAELIRGMIDQLVTVGNRTYQGMYLFGGQQTTRTPFTQGTGGVEYNGDDAALRASVDYQEDPAFNVTGTEVFGAMATQVTGAVDLNPRLTVDTRLSDLGGTTGGGINASSLRVAVSSPARAFTVDLSVAATVGDVLDLLNDAAADVGLTVGAGGEFNATLNPAGDGLQLTSAAGTVSVTEIGQGVTARDLGLLGAPAGNLVGGNLNPLLRPTTRVADLLGGAGVALGSIRIENGPNSATIDLSGAVTVQDVLNSMNAAGVYVRARINDAGTGIDVVNRLSGSELSIGEAGGNTAEVLGIRSMYAATRLVDMNDGDGVGTRSGLADLRIVARDGSVVDVNLDGASTVGDVLAAINAAAAAAGVAVTASMASTGNGIRVTDATGGAGILRVESLNASSAAEDLGLLKSAAAGSNELVGDDVNGRRTESVFSALYDLFDALIAGGDSHQQEMAITRAGERLTKFIDSSNRLQGVVGARSRAMSTHLDMTEDAVTSTRALLSEVKDLDYTEAITKFQQAQTALQGNLMTGPRMMQMSLLDFLS